MVSELEDRFGRMPSELEMLVKIIKIKTIMKRLKAVRLDKVGGDFRLTFLQSTPVGLDDIRGLLNGGIIKMKGNRAMQLTFEPLLAKGIDGILGMLEALVPRPVEKEAMPESLKRN
ncbi:MAG: hypothetical protein M1491_04795 [Deltaproteobacteria bacterium]|nr:hypothetical protein [Deltaproteobacteria bacterium]